MSTSNSRTREAKALRSQEFKARIGDQETLNRKKKKGVGSKEGGRLRKKIGMRKRKGYHCSQLWTGARLLQACKKVLRANSSRVFTMSVSVSCGFHKRSIAYQVREGSQPSMYFITNPKKLNFPSPILGKCVKYGFTNSESCLISLD